MTDRLSVVITGSGAVCAAGMTPDEMLDADPRRPLVDRPDRAVGHDGLALPRRGGDRRLQPARARRRPQAAQAHPAHGPGRTLRGGTRDRALRASSATATRSPLDDAAVYSDRTGVYVGSGGGNYENQYDYFPLFAAAGGELPAFGRELANTVNPMWLLRTLPNNVLGHIGIKHGLKGPNACITNHSCGGTLAIIEAFEALRHGEADRAVAVGHETPIEPQMVLYYQRLGLLASEMLRPFDARHDGSLFGEGAGALLLETVGSARARNATVLGEVLGGGYACEAEGLAAIRDDGDGLARAIDEALRDAKLDRAAVGMIVAHGNGTPQSDVSEAAAIRRVFGAASPPVTAFKWAIGHTIAAAGILEATLALAALARNTVPGIANLATLDPACAGLSVSTGARAPRSKVALILCRGFAGTNAALVVRAA